MKTLSKLLALTAIASLSVACASGASLPKTAAEPMPRTCAGQNVSTDDQVRALAGCTHIDGDLTISGAVTTLAPLASVETVRGTLAVQSTLGFTSLDGLERLHEVSQLVLSDNPELEDISALSALAAVRSITLKQNPSLEGLNGLEGVRSLERLTIERSGLFTLRGLNNVGAVRELAIVKNPRLIQLHALSEVHSVERLTVVGNRRLSGYGGLLKNLQRLPTFATVSGNPLTVAEIAHLSQSEPKRSSSGFASIDANRVASAQ